MDRHEVIYQLSKMADDTGLTDPLSWDQDEQAWRLKAIEALDEAVTLLKGIRTVGTLQLTDRKYYVVEAGQTQD